VSFIPVCNFLQHSLGTPLGLQRQGELSLPFHQGAFPWTDKGRYHQVPMYSLFWNGNHPPGKSEQGPQRHTWPREMQETARDGNTTHQSGMNPGLISDQSQEAEGEIDHLLETTRYHSNHGETVPLRFSEWDGSTGLWECVKVLSWDAASCKASEEYWSLGPWPTHKVYFPAEKPLVYSVMPIS
jgi:hypothetical protein